MGIWLGVVVLDVHGPVTGFGRSLGALEEAAGAMTGGALTAGSEGTLSVDAVRWELIVRRSAAIRDRARARTGASADARVEAR
jgi:hypothetical protein